MYYSLFTRGTLSFLPVAALFYTGSGVAFTPHTGRLQHVVWKRAMLPLHIAEFAIKPPDRVLLMPVAGVHKQEIANTWHARRGRRKHEGEDIFAPRGTPVFSATNGVVTRITNKTIGGNSIFIAGAGNRIYYYTHLHRYARGIEVGDTVSSATLIGYVGNTGNARTTPAHLHFGVYGRAGRPIDPLPLLADRGTVAQGD